MLKRQVLRRLIFFFLSATSLMLAIDTSMGQVRFEAPINLSDKAIDSWNSDIYAVEDQVFVFWLDRVPENDYVMLAHSIDEGRTFRISYLSPGIDYPGFARVVADGDYVYVAFPGIPDRSDPRAGGTFLSRSDDRGRSFSPPFDITGRGQPGDPRMYIQDGVLNVFWSSWEGIFFTKSKDFGKSFREPVMASPKPSSGTASASYTVEGDQLYAAWMEHAGRLFYQIFFTHSTDGGDSFSEALNLSRTTAERGMSQDPQVAIGGNGYLYAAWTQGVEMEPLSALDVHIARSTDGGETFDKRLNVSNNPGASNRGTRMLASGDNVYLTWSGVVGGFNVFFSRSTDGGETFSEPRNISQSRGGAANVRMAVIEKGTLQDYGINQDVIYLAWQDGRMGYPQVFFSVSLDGGATFSEPENISRTGSYASGPSLAVVGRNIYVTWMGRAAGHWSTLYVRGHLELERKSHPIRKPGRSCVEK